MHGIVYVPESEIAADPLESEGTSSLVVLKLDLEGLRAGTAPFYRRRRRRSYTKQLLIILVAVLVKALFQLVSQVKDEQSYIVMRERTHRNTAESTNGRVKWWSIFQLGVLIGEGIFQVWWLKRFFEVYAFSLEVLITEDVFANSG